MKRGRKKLVGEKADTYDKVTLMLGRAPAAKYFIDNIRALARLTSTDPHRAEFFSVSIIDLLIQIGAKADEDQAKFFDDVAKCLRARKDWGPDGVVDIRRLLLKYILHADYRSRPVDLGKVARQIRFEGKVDVDERWISRESKKLGFQVQRRGRR